MLPHGWEWVIIIIAAFLLFGPKKLPELAKSVGQAIREFKKNLSQTGDEDDAGKPASDAPREAQ
ncbi:MAG TPA: twin-arginine translocase TatA/TatE family subunit [Armatimonadota bacterium]|nr:twin-arginine translocase TatA/TatE family subunit [Armatimonadota bacterium]